MKQPKTITLSPAQAELVQDLVEEELIRAENNYNLQYRGRITTSLRAVLQQIDPTSRLLKHKSSDC